MGAEPAAPGRFRERVYGPELMLRLCDRAAEEGVSIYLYGSDPAVIEQLRANLLAKFPRLIVAGAESPPFRELTAAEEEAMLQRIRTSGAGLVFVGLGPQTGPVRLSFPRPPRRGPGMCGGRVRLPRGDQEGARCGCSDPA